MIRAMIAAAETPPATVWNTLAEQGPLGVAVVVLGWFAWKMVSWLLARNERLEQEKSELHTAIQDKVIPAVLAATATATEGLALIREVQRDRERERDRERYYPRRDGAEGGT